MQITDAEQSQPSSPQFNKLAHRNSICQEWNPVKFISLCMMNSKFGGLIFRGSFIYVIVIRHHLYNEVGLFI